MQSWSVEHYWGCCFHFHESHHFNSFKNLISWFGEKIFILRRPNWGHIHTIYLKHNQHTFKAHDLPSKFWDRSLLRLLGIVALWEGNNSFLWPFFLMFAFWAYSVDSRGETKPYKFQTWPPVMSKGGIIKPEMKRTHFLPKREPDTCTLSLQISFCLAWYLLLSNPDVERVWPWETHSKADWVWINKTWVISTWVLNFGLS